MSEQKPTLGMIVRYRHHGSVTDTPAIVISEVLVDLLVFGPTSLHRRENVQHGAAPGEWRWLHERA